MDINEVKDLMSQFDQSTLKEFDLKKGSFEIYMNKNEICRVNTMTNAAQGEVVEPASKTTESAAVAVSEATPAEVKPVPVPSGKEIISPIVGIVYLQATPDDPFFKSVGDTVKKGEVVCIVEAMKVMNEITSDMDGVITEILVENEQIVEFGQPLFRVQ